MSNLKATPDEVLVLELKALVREERELTTRILHYMEEVDRRRIFLEQGYPSLFEWCTGVLGYSTGAAHRRIQSMRLMRSLPEIEARLASGDLSLSVAAQAQSYFKQEDLRRKEKKALSMTLQEKQAVVSELVGVSARECERKLATLSPEQPGREKVRVISETQVMIQFTATRELMGKLEELKSLLSHQVPGQRMDQLIEKLADLALKKLKPEPTKAKVTPVKGDRDSDAGKRSGFKTGNARKSRTTCQDFSSKKSPYPKVGSS